MRFPFRQRFKETVGFIESWFGVEWLLKQTQQAVSTHPIPLAWLDLAILLSNPTWDPPPHEARRFASFVETAETIRLAARIPNAYAAITRERLAGEAFHNHLYTASMAVLSQTLGFETAFVVESRTQSVKTPDILLMNGGFRCFLECKHRDPFEQVRDPGAVVRRISEEFDRLPINDEHGIDVHLLLADELGRSAAAPIMHLIEEGLRSRQPGIHALPQYGCTLGLAITRRPDAGKRIPFSMPKKPMIAKLATKVMVDRDRVLHMKGQNRFLVHRLQADPFGRLSSKIGKAAKQIGKDCVGLVAIQVDMSALSIAYRQAYHRLAAVTLGYAFTPERNTRIAGIILTEASLPHVGESSIPHLWRRRMMSYIHNPHGAWPIALTPFGHALPSE